MGSLLRMSILNLDRSWEFKGLKFFINWIQNSLSATAERISLVGNGKRRRITVAFTDSFFFLVIGEETMALPLNKDLSVLHLLYTNVKH